MSRAGAIMLLGVIWVGLGLAVCLQFELGLVTCFGAIAMAAGLSLFTTRPWAEWVVRSTATVLGAYCVLLLTLGGEVGGRGDSVVGFLAFSVISIWVLRPDEVPTPP